MPKTFKQKGTFGSSVKKVSEHGRPLPPKDVGRKITGKKEQITIPLENPFKTKIANNNKKVENTDENVIHDKSEKNLKEKFSRPYFSPKHNSYEADLAEFENKKREKLIKYLFLININTKKLYIHQLEDKTGEEIINAIRTMIYHGLVINNIRMDAESGILSDTAKKFFQKRNIDMYITSSPYINKSRVVDRVIRTIRDMYENVFHNRWNCTVSEHNIRMQSLCDIYNKTYHSSVKKAPNNVTVDDEEKFIKEKQKELNDVLKLQNQSSLLSMKKGDPIRVYLDPSKTKDAFKKKRMKYYHNGTFVKYNSGNVVCEIQNKRYEVPIYHVILLKK